MELITYKYFIAEGESIAHTIAFIKTKQAAHQDRISDLLEKHGADCLWGGRRESPFAIGWIWKRPEGEYRAKPPMRENFLKPEVERSGDVTYACYRPDQRYKAGKQIKAELKAVGGFSFSDAICEAMGVDRNVFGVLDGRQVVCRSSAGACGNKLVFRIPVGGAGNIPFESPDGFREIKKSEFIAITEESP